MKHCILVKFNKDYDWKTELPNIKKIFDGIKLDGVNKVEYITNCIDRENRYDLLIRIDLKKEALSLYDACPNHHEWKDTYSQYIDKKAIFDYE
ncbi:MAG: hypothetical protein E7338_05310 [Clostridiales bacterium]|nr:hypothetical protein [Clostridiales bacterium]